MSNVIDLPKKKEMTIPEAAEYLGWAPTTLRNKLQNGEGPRKYKRGGRLFFLKADLDSYLKEITEVTPAFSKYSK